MERSMKIHGVSRVASGREGLAPSPSPVPEPEPRPGRRIACVLLRGDAATAGYARSRQRFQELAEACLRFTPLVAARGDEALFLDVTACRSLLRESPVSGIPPKASAPTEHGFLLRLTTLASRFGCRVRITISGDPGTALAMARHGCAHPELLPVDALTEYASPFRADAKLEARVAAVISTLNALGIESLQEFAKLPPGTLASRFGPEGVDLGHRICDSFGLPWPGLRLPERVFERLELEDGCESLETALFCLKGMIDRSMARLRGRALRASIVELQFTLERGLPRRWSIVLPVAQGTASGLLPILRERLGFDIQRRPLEAPIRTICFRVLETAPGRGSQRDFFDRRENEGEERDALLGRLAERLGPDRAFEARTEDRHLPEGAWSQAPPGNVIPLRAAAPAPVPPRPTRLLKRPEPLLKEGDLLVIAARADRPDTSSKRNHWRVVEWDGPERITGEWWLESGGTGFQRDYYRAVTDAGEQLWVFQHPRGSGFYLHGFFD